MTTVSARVQEADVAEHVAVLKVRIPGRSAFVVVSAAGADVGAALVVGDVKREAWGGGRLPRGTARQRGREDALLGAEVVAVEPDAVLLRQDERLRVLRPRGGRVVVLDAEEDPRPRADVPPLAVVLEDDVARAALEERGRALVHAIADLGLDLRRLAVVQALQRAVKTLERRRDAVQADLAKMGEATALAASAPWLVAEAARAPRGATKLTITDWSTGEAVTRDVPLDPARSARDQVEAMFRRAKRLKAGTKVAEQRLAQTDDQRAQVEGAIAAARAASSFTELEDALGDAKRAAPREVRVPEAEPTPGARKGRPQAAKHHRVFLASSGRKLLVGKGAQGNDVVTHKLARPFDLWLHAKDRTGAHVIAVLDKGHPCPPEDLVEAAHLAAHFSDAKGESIVDVQTAERRHLRKPKGSPAGFVIVDREKVLVLRVDANLLRALLEREEIGS